MHVGLGEQVDQDATADLKNAKNSEYCTHDLPSRFSPDIRATIARAQASKSASLCLVNDGRMHNGWNSLIRFHWDRQSSAAILY